MRDAQPGLETFMVRRHVRSPVAPSAYVFPGGTVRTDDAEVQPSSSDVSNFGRWFSEHSDAPLPGSEAISYYVSALRELFEEAGVLLVRDSAQRLLAVDAADSSLQERLASTRLALQARDLSLARVLAEWRWAPAFDLLVPFSHWITPSAMAARFDTRFFVAEMPPGQAALHDTIETSEGVWLRPRVVLDGDYQVVYATAQHLLRLSAFQTVAELLAFARQKPIRTVQPEVRESGSGFTVLMPPELVDDW